MIKKYNKFLLENLDEWEEEEEEDDQWDFIDIKFFRDNKIKIEKILSIFMEFLREKNIEYEYLTNLENAKTTVNFTKTYENKIDFFRRFGSRDWVVYAFSWIDTPEGEDFWHKIHNEWTKIINSLTGMLN